MLVSILAQETILAKETIRVLVSILAQETIQA